MKIVVVLAGLLVVAGCTKTVEEMSFSEREVLATQIQKRCLDQGTVAGTPRYRACLQIEAQREVSTRRRQAAVEDAHRSSGVSVCNRVGYTVICS